MQSTPHPSLSCSTSGHQDEAPHGSNVLPLRRAVLFLGSCLQRLSANHFTPAGIPHRDHSAVKRIDAPCLKDRKCYRRRQPLILSLFRVQGRGQARVEGCGGFSAGRLRIRGEITASILRFVPSPSHGLISLVPWEPTASVADLETAAVNSPRILSPG